MQVSKIAVNCWIVVLLGLVAKGQCKPNKCFLANGWHEFSLNFIATDVTLID
jgi:hypothetical protein